MVWTKSWNVNMGSRFPKSQPQAIKGFRREWSQFPPVLCRRFLLKLDLAVLEKFRSVSDLYLVEKHDAFHNPSSSLPIHVFEVFPVEWLVLVITQSVSSPIVPNRLKNFLLPFLHESQGSLDFLWTWGVMHVQLWQSKMQEGGFICWVQVSRWHLHQVSDGQREWETSRIWLQGFQLHATYGCLARSFKTFCTAPINSIHHPFHIMYSAKVAVLSLIQM